MSLISPISAPIWAPFWVNFLNFRVPQGIKKCSKIRCAKYRKLCPNWCPNGSGGLTEMGPLGALVGHLGPEVPHKGLKGSKMTPNVHKQIKNLAQFYKNITARILVFCSPSASKAPGAWRGGVLPKAAQSAAPVRLGRRQAWEISCS